LNFFEKLLGYDLPKNLTHKQIFNEIQQSRYSIINCTNRSIVPSGDCLSKIADNSDDKNDLITIINEFIDSMSVDKLYRFYDIIVALFGKKKY
jgi:hypothetical protein